MALGARKAFQEITNEAERSRWLSLPFTGCDGRAGDRPSLGTRKMAHGDDPHSTAYGTGDGDSGKSQSRRNPTAGTRLYHVLLDSSDRIIGSAKSIGSPPWNQGGKKAKDSSE